MSGTPPPANCKTKTMVPHLHSVQRVPDLHAVAGAGHYATTRAGQTFHQAHILVPKQPACQNTPFCALELELSQVQMQAPGPVGRPDFIMFARFPFLMDARCSLQARRMPCLCFAATNPQANIDPPPTAPSQALRAMTCIRYRFISMGGPLHRTAVPLIFWVKLSAKQRL